MTIESLKKAFSEKGFLEGIAYYAGRFLSKIQIWTMGHVVIRFLKLSPKRIVFKNRKMQDYTDNTRAFFEYLQENNLTDQYQIIWLVSDKKKFMNLKKIPNVKVATAENRFGFSSPFAYYYSATAKYFFFTHNNGMMNHHHCQGQVAINLWHGCGYKSTTEKERRTKDQPMMQFDYALVPGPVFVDTKSKLWRCPKEKIITLGYPRYDWMLHPGIQKETILHTFFKESSKDEKLIVWMPTYRKNDQDGFEESALEPEFGLPVISKEEELLQLDRFLAENHIRLIVKRHPFQVKWEQEKISFSNIHFTDQEELDQKEILLYKMLGVCDGLISDYSSVSVDFMLLDRPLGYILSDMELYKEKRGFSFENPMEYMPGDKIYNFDDLIEFICQTANGNDLWKERRNNLLPLMHNKRPEYCRALAEFLDIV